MFSLWRYNVPAAFFSGLAVAVAILDQQTSSLVGVAISASLLPPAVNSGILLMAWRHSDPETLDTMKDEETNFGRMAIMSIVLTAANIVLIICSSILMFRVKEVLPIKKAVFWEDLGFARKIYQGKATARISSRPGNKVMDISGEIQPE